MLCKRRVNNEGDRIWCFQPKMQNRLYRLRFAILLVLWFFSVSTTSIPGLSAFAYAQQSQKPAWCEELPRPQYKGLTRVSITDPWFEVYKVAPNTFAIYEPHQAEETIGYLILGNRQALLFDTGMGISDVKKIAAELTALPILVLNSHTHNDHVGGNWEFNTVLGVDTEFTRAQAKGSKGDAQGEISPSELCGDLPKDFVAQSYATRAWKIARTVRDGETIDLGGRSIEIIATPGHTPDSISILDRVNGLLFTGDTYYPGTIWLYRPETDFDQYGTSILRLATLASKVKVVLGAHNIPIAPPSVLPQLVEAYDAVRAGKASCETIDPRKRKCTAYGISFLLPPNLPVVHSP